MGKRKIISLLLLFSVAFFALHFTKQSPVRKILRTMSQEERQILSDFFAELIENNCFGQTLMGEKPVSFEHSLAVSPKSFDIFTSNRASFFIWRAEKVWRKYSESFQLKDFVLKFHREKNVLTVFLIHKAAFLNCVRTNISLFKQIIGATTSPEILLEAISNKDSAWDTVLHDSAVLEGIVLGFGVQNSKAYEHYEDIYQALYHPLPPPWIEEHDPDNGALSQNQESQLFLNKRWRTASKTSTSHLMKPGKGFSSIEEEYCWFQNKYGKGSSLRSTSSPIARYKTPIFLVDDQDPEVIGVLATYEKTKIKLAELYASGDFLEITLRKLTGEL